MTDSPTKRISRRRFQAKAISYSQPAPDTTRHPPKEKPPPPAHPTDHLTSSTGTSKTKPLPPHKRESRIGANRSSNVTSDCTIPVFGPFLSPQAVTIVRCTVRFIPVTATKIPRRLSNSARRASVIEYAFSQYRISHRLMT